MPFPVTLATRQIHADIRDSTGTAAVGSVTFTNPYWLFDETGNAVLAPGSYTAALVDGEATLEVPATDAPGVTPTGRTLTVQLRVGAVRTTYAIEVPSGVGTLELADLPPVASPPAVVTYATAAQLAATNTELDTLGQVAFSTGVADGGQLNINALDASQIDITAMKGYVVDYVTVPEAPTVTLVETPLTTVAMDAGALSRSATWWLYDVDGNVIQQANRPDAAQRRTHIMLGVTLQEAGLIVNAQSLPVILQGTGSQLVDLIEALSPFNISGNEITPNGANLQINQSSGRVFARAFSHFVNDVLTNSPHTLDSIAQTPAVFQYATRSSTVLPAAVNTIDVGHYDNNGVVTAIPGGASSSTIHRVYLFPSGDATRQLIVQYGQTVYSSLANAVAAIGGSPFTVNPFLVKSLGALVAHIAVIRTATNLSDPAQATIHLMGRFNDS